MVTFGRGMKRLEVAYEGLLLGGVRTELDPQSERTYLHDLEVFEVDVEDGSSDVSEHRMEEGIAGMVSRWPEVATALREAVFHYGGIYDEAFSYRGGGESERVIMPSPTGSEVVDDLFTIRAIVLSADTDLIGLLGTCTWDQEHAFGAVVDGTEIVKVGAQSDAFNPSHLDEAVAPPVEPEWSVDRTLYYLSWKGAIRVL